MQYVIMPTNDDIAHSRGPWKKHKYSKKIGKRYVYAKNKMSEASTNAKYKMMYGQDPEKNQVKDSIKNYTSLIGDDSNRDQMRRTKAFIGIGKAIWSEHKEAKRLKKAKASSFGSALLTAGKRLVNKILSKFKK